MTTTKFVICMQNTGYEASLELRKLYRVLPDSRLIPLASFEWWMNPVKTIFTLLLSSCQSTFPIPWQSGLHMLHE